MNQRWGDLKDFRNSREFFEQKFSWIFTGFIGLLGGLFLTFLLWASIGQMDIVVKAHAIIRPFQNVSTLKNSASGPVVLKRFTNGGQVHQGDVLWKVGANASDIDLKNTQLQLVRNDQKRRTLDAYTLAMTTGLELGASAGQEAKNRAALYFSELQRLDLTHRKAFESWQRESRLPANMVLSQKVKELETEEKLTALALDTYKGQERIKVQEEATGLQQEQETLSKRVADLRRQVQDSEVCAPLSGTVVELKSINVGDFLFVGDEVLKIIPDSGEKVKVELSVDNRDIAEVKIGMPITLRLNALPLSEFGQVEGRVEHIAADALYTTNAPAVFVVEAVLNKAFLVSKKGERIELKAGMGAEGRILIKRKNILTSILESLDFL